MADHEEDSVVIRIVYDGPPEAGKTTSLRALARSFGREVYTPEEQDGRTVYFDWLEHTGGRFDGAPIRCEIVSVPGQERWLKRRTHFLERADAVVFVGDTSEAGWPETVVKMRDLRRRLEARDGPAVGVVVQANRRDATDAVPIDVVRQELAARTTAVVESVALDGTGVRESFVFAVRLALDRARELELLGNSRRGAPLRDSHEVLGVLKGFDVAAAPAEPPRNASGVPMLPSVEVPSGLVWPPVEGRVRLREAIAAAVEPRLTPEGDYESEPSGGFRIHSYASAVFADLEQGRTALIEWARFHATAQWLLSHGRCIALAETGDGRFRLWQIVRSEPSLLDLFGDGAEPLDPHAEARRLASAGRRLTEAKVQCAVSSLNLPCSLDTIGISDMDRPVYVGLAPSEGWLRSRPPDAEEVASELASLLRDRPQSEREAVRHAVQSTQAAAFGPASGLRIAELLTALLAS